MDTNKRTDPKKPLADPRESEVSRRVSAGICRTFLDRDMTTDELSERCGIKHDRVVQILAGTDSPIYVTEIAQLAAVFYPSDPAALFTAWFKVSA